jgi:excisionase family DNA binding protein
MTQTDYTIKQAAAMLGCSTQTVVARIKAGRIKACRLGGIGPYRIPADEIEKARSGWPYKPDTSQAL